MSWVEFELLANGKYRIWLKWWHPGFWREAYRTIRRTAGVLASVYFTFVLVMSMAKRKR